MLKIHNYATISSKQMQMVIAGTRNPLESWGLSDSIFFYDGHAHVLNDKGHIHERSNPLAVKNAQCYTLGEKDKDLLARLAKGGSVNAKYRRMIPVWVDIEAPLYWWKEFDTYKVGTVSNSCSTMHCIHKHPFTVDDFSHEHLFNETIEVDASISDADFDPLTDAIEYEIHGEITREVSMNSLEDTIEKMNFYRERYLEARENKCPASAKKYWWQMIQLLPSSYNQRRMIFMTYENLNNMQYWRHDHKLDEWHTFCDWIDTLPHADLIKIAFQTPETATLKELAKFLVSLPDFSEEHPAEAEQMYSWIQRLDKYLK